MCFVSVRPGGRLGRSGSSASFGSTLLVTVFGQVRIVCSGTPRESVGSFGLILFVWKRPEGLWVHASAMSGCGLGVAGFFRVRLVRPGAPRGWLGSFGFVCFVRVRPGDRLVLSHTSSSSWCAVVGHWVRSRSSASFGCALGVAGFVRVRLVRPRAP